MLNNQELMHKLFQRLPYKIKSEFVRISNESSSGGTFHELRVLVEKAASAAEVQIVNTKDYFVAARCQIQRRRLQSLETAVERLCVLPSNQTQ